jgi:hypothetical protein
MAVADTWTAGADWATNEKPVAASKLNQQVRDNVYVLSIALDGDTSGTTIKHRHLSGVAGSRPAAGEAGRTYFATDTKTLSVDNGTTWDTPVTIVRKSADQSVSSGDTGTTLQDDDDLKIPMVANESHAFEAFIDCVGHTSGDIKIAFTVPAGATLVWAGIGPLLSAGSTHAELKVIKVSGTAQAYDTETGVDRIIHIMGSVENAGNAGDLQLQFAQNSAHATNTTIFENSWLKAHSMV